MAARRELEEETGYRAARWERLTDFWTAPGFATERMFLYLATDLAAAGPDRRAPDEDEALELVAPPLAGGRRGRRARRDPRREVARRDPLAGATHGGRAGGLSGRRRAPVRPGGCASASSAGDCAGAAHAAR